MAWRQADYAQAIIWHEHALELYRTLGDAEGVAFAFNNVGTQFVEQGDLTSAMQRYTESLALSQHAGIHALAPARYTTWAKWPAFKVTMSEQ
jgi:hypothetical protein